MSRYSGVGPLRQLVLAFALVATAPYAAEAATRALDEAQAVKREDTAAFAKWHKMLQRFEKAHHSASNCTNAPLGRCPREEWQGFLKGLQTADLNTKLNAVNMRVNHAYYITDIRNWGVTDYWATPFEFFSRDGDCEDYAIAKYLSLKALGVDPAQMRIVVVEDTNLGVPHAVLTVETPRTTLVLDNQVDTVVDAQAVHHYRPIYAINETAWWLYQPRRSHPYQ